LGGETPFLWAVDCGNGNKVVNRLWKNPVDLPTALNPVEYDLGIGCNLTPDPVLPDSDTIIILKPSHFVDIEITKNIF
jgi:hypothetical protein